VGVRAAGRVSVEKGVGGGVIGVVPRLAGDAVPVAARVDAWDAGVVDLAGNVDI
jgi:hypothetical protein